MEQGKLHIYCGDGKGKTTAAVGLALRCAGSGRQVIFSQFLKDGSSSEVKELLKIPQIRVMVCQRAFGFTFRMTPEEKQEAGTAYQKLWEEVLDAACLEKADLLVLDELLPALSAGLVDEQQVLSFLRDRPEHMEVVLTGRNAGEDFLSLADYVTEMRSVKHPYGKGLAAREGIEY